MTMEEDIAGALALPNKADAIKRVFWELLGFDPADDELYIELVTGRHNGHVERADVRGLIGAYQLVRVVYRRTEYLKRAVVEDTCRQATRCLGPCLLLMTQVTQTHWVLAHLASDGETVRQFPLFEEPRHTARYLAGLADYLEQQQADEGPPATGMEVAGAVDAHVPWAKAERRLGNWLAKYDRPRTPAVEDWFRHMTRYELFTQEQERQAFMDLERRWPLGPQRNELENPPPPEAQPLYEECLNRNLRLAAWTAFRYRRGMGRANELVDLLQEGAIGLMLAVRRYDVHRGHRFSTYAYQWVRQRISRYLDDTGKPVRVPVHLADGIRRAKRREEWYWHMYGMAPGPLAFHEDEDLAVLGKLPTVLHRPQRLPETQAQLDSWDSIGASDRQHFLVDGLAPIHERLLCHGLDTCLTATLSPREKLVIELRFGLNGYVAHTLEQTGNQFGLSRERIRQIEKHAINKLQRNTGMRVLDGPRRRKSKKPTTPKKPGTRTSRHTPKRSRHAARHH